MSSTALEFYRREDHCEYYIFPKLIGNENEGDNNETEFFNILDEIKTIISKYCDGYIWHKDGFNLSPRFKFNQLLREEDNKNEIGKKEIQRILVYLNHKSDHGRNHNLFY